VNVYLAGDGVGVVLGPIGLYLFGDGGVFWYWRVHCRGAGRGRSLAGGAAGGGRRQPRRRPGGGFVHLAIAWGVLCHLHVWAIRADAPARYLVRGELFGL